VGTLRHPIAEDISPTLGGEAVTTAYAGGWVSAWFNCENLDEILLLATLTPSGLTSMDLRTEAEDRGSTDGFEEWALPDPSASPGVLKPDEVSILNADLPTGNRIAFPLDVRNAARFRLRAKADAGGSSLQVEVIGSGTQ